MELTSEEHDEYQRLVGEEIYERLEKLLDYEHYQQASDEGKIAKIVKAERDARAFIKRKWQPGTRTFRTN